MRNNRKVLEISLITIFFKIYTPVFLFWKDTWKTIYCSIDKYEVDPVIIFNHTYNDKMSVRPNTKLLAYNLQFHINNHSCLNGYFATTLKLKSLLCQKLYARKLSYLSDNKRPYNLIIQTFISNLKMRRTCDFEFYIYIFN